MSDLSEEEILSQFALNGQFIPEHEDTKPFTSVKQQETNEDRYD